MHDTQNNNSTSSVPDSSGDAGAVAVDPVTAMDALNDAVELVIDARSPLAKTNEAVWQKLKRVENYLAKQQHELLTEVLA